MFRSKYMAGAVLAAAMSTGVNVPAIHAQNNNGNAQGGLVNVNVQVTRVIDDVTVDVEDINVAVAAAANIMAQVCGTNVGVAALLAELEQAGVASCENGDTGSSVDVTQQ